MNRRIIRLKMTHFRGATRSVEMQIQAEKPLVVIYGENGSGKSTLIDAIDFICNQKLGSVALRSSTTKNHIPSVGMRLADIAVELETQQEVWRGTLTPSGVSIAPQSSPPPASILRRSQLLRLIEAQPATRYEELKRFIDAESVEKCETTLRNSCNAAQKRLDTAIAILDTATQTLAKQWEAERKPGESSTEWAKEKAQADVSLLESKTDLFTKVIEALREAQRSREELSLAGESLEKTQNTLAQIEEERREAERHALTGSASLATLLKEAQSYLLGSGAAGICPVCEKSADRDNLLTRLAERLSEMESLQTIGSRLERAKITLNQVEGRTNNAQIQWLESAQRLIHALQKSQLKAVERLDLDSKESIAFLNGELTDEQALQHTEALFQRVATWQIALEGKRAALQVDIDQHNLIRIHYEQAENARRETLKANLLTQRLKAMLESVQQTRLQFVAKILRDVNGECNRLYTRLHPHEPLGAITLSVKENVRGSVETKALFGNQMQIPPQAYYSEAHLDTLGFCLFMALARHTHGGGGILVLDDIFAAVDADHATRIVDLLFEESANFAQIILTTHSRAWFEKFYYHLSGAESCHLVELLPWTLERGIRADFNPMEG